MGRADLDQWPTLVSHGRIDWRWPLAIILIVILFVPMRRYALPVNLPFELELYRVIVALVIVVWMLSLLAQPDAAIRRSGLEGPVLLYAFAFLASDFANPGRMAQYQSYVIRGAEPGSEHCRRLLLRRKRGPEVLAGADHREAPRRGYVCSRSPGPDRVENGMVSVRRISTGTCPCCNKRPRSRGNTRGAVRALGSAEHPIALGALFVIIAPLALYLAIRFGRWWWAICGHPHGGDLRDRLPHRGANDGRLRAWSCS